MVLIFKLVGLLEDGKSYQIRDSFEGIVNLNLLNELFSYWGIKTEDLAKIKFITDSEQLKNSDKNFVVKSDEERIIFVFTSDVELRNNLGKIFKKEGSAIDINTKILQKSEEPSVTKIENKIPDPEICKPITTNESEPIPKFTSELIDTMNVKAVSLFSDQDFRTLISVYLRRPELFSTLALYVQHGNVIEESLMPSKTLDDLNDDELVYYKSLADKINHLELGVTNDVIINKLIKFSGHLNLTVRSILCDMAK